MDGLHKKAGHASADLHRVAVATGYNDMMEEEFGSCVVSNKHNPPLRQLNAGG